MNPVKRLQYSAIVCAAALALGVGLNAPSRADCHASYTQAVTLLDSTTQKASANQHPDPDAFANQFKSVVNQLQTEKCMPELMNLIQHIQGEQKKLPAQATPSEKPSPVMD